jgi:hypothetical protein
MVASWSTVASPRDGIFLCIGTCRIPFEGSPINALRRSSHSE